MGKNRSQFLERLDMLRGAAALYVALTHSIIWNMVPRYSVLGIFFSFGEEAVMLFFLLSGFVIYYSVTKEKEITFKKYFIKRFHRIYPLLFISFILSYVVFSVQVQHYSPVNMKEFFGNFFMLQSNADMNPGSWFDTFYYNVPLWSLAFEWYFYMLFYPINKYVRPQHTYKVVLGLSLFGYITFFLHPNQLSAVLLYFLIWWVGVELARSYVKFNCIYFSAVSFYIVALATLTLLLIVPVILFYKSTDNFGDYPLIQLRHFGSALLLILIGFYWSRHEFIGFDNIFSVFKKIAPISYGLYIFHYPILNCTRFMSNISFQPLRLILLLLSALIFSYFFEIHFQKAITRLIFRRKTPILIATH